MGSFLICLQSETVTTCVRPKVLTNLREEDEVTDTETEAWWT